jgi:hypothetical protein
MSRTACAPGVLRTGIDERSGELLSQAVLVARVGWLTDLVAAMAGGLVTEHWNTTDLDVLAAGLDLEGRKLPSHAWMALRRLDWKARAPEGVTVNDRIVRMAQEQAGRLLRSVTWRIPVTAGVLATWPADPAQRTAHEWDLLRGAVPGGEQLPSSVLKGRTRQISAYVKRTGRLPSDVFEVEDPPRTGRMLLLAACDSQQATFARGEQPGQAVLRLQLPTRPDPRSYRDFTWVACPITLPATIPAGAVLHLPALRTRGGRIRVDLAYTHAVPRTSATGHTVALGVDWGLNTLLSAGAVRAQPDGQLRTLGSGAMFRAAGVIAKAHRLRRLSEHLHTKADHYHRLIQGRARRGLPPDPALDARHATLRQEIGRVSARRSNLNTALARAAARWTLDQAIAAGASVIYLEDLRSMEARGMGRTINTRLSQQVRGQITDHLRHLAAETGIAVVTVPARGTSKHCPHCLTPLQHRKAPDRPTTPGWKWARCSSCGYQGDRDHGAWQRIAARGLTHQNTTHTDRTTKALLIRTVVDTLETEAVITPHPPKTGRDRSKTGPTRPRSTPPTPRRRRTPSPTRPPGLAGKRPEGHASTDRPRLPRAAHRHQSAHTISTPTQGHRPKGAARGAGFHLNAHATPPKWEHILPPDITSDTGSLS